jgi:predicted short-subunit dehydrogenase-like oxidoreductase (DUF2520 family)
MNQEQKESFVVIGAGRVGTAMARVLADAGYPCLGLFGRRAERVRASSEFTGAPGYDELRPDIVNRARAVLIGVPDGAIESVARQIADRGAVGRGAVLMHFSGLVTSEALEPAAAAAGGRASVHPNLAMADSRTAVSKIPGTYFGIEGDETGKALALKMVGHIGGIGVSIPLEGKTAYHLAAVFASNGMVVLASMAAEILSGIGVSPQDAEKITSKLMLGTAQNLFELDLLRALTGPVVRGDAETVSAHLGAMKSMSPDMDRVYRLLFRRMVALGTAAGRGTEESYRPIMTLLK